MARKRSTHQRLYLLEKPTSDYIRGRAGLALHIPSLELGHRITMRRLDDIARAQVWTEQHARGGASA